MEKAFRNLLMEIFTKGCMPTANLMVMVNITGQMVVILKDFLKMDYGMDKECGKKVLGIVINMKDNI